MKKTLIASAIAAVSFSGVALAAESNLPTVYGNIQYALIHNNVDGGDSSLDHRDNGTTLGVLHDHEIAPGITGFLKVELEGIGANNKADSSGIDSLDEAYIGVRGDNFGQIWVGSDDSTYETAIDTIANFYEAADLSIGGSYSTGEGDLVQYMSPSFGGLTLGAAVQVNGDSTEGGKSYPYQLAAIYAVDSLELAFAMDSNDGTTEYSSKDAGIDNENTYGLRGTYSAGSMSLTGEYQTRKDFGDTYGVMGVYTLGANQFALSYEMFSADADDSDRNTITLQALHNVSDNMYVYVEGYIGGGDDVYGGVDAVEPTYDDPAGSAAVGAFSDERSVAAVGAVYYF